MSAKNSSSSDFSEYGFVLFIGLGFCGRGKLGFSLFNIWYVTHTHLVLLWVELYVSPEGGIGVKSNIY